MRLTFIPAVAIAALMLGACATEIEVEENADTTATSDTGMLGAPATTDTGMGMVDTTTTGTTTTGSDTTTVSGGATTGGATTGGTTSGGTTATGTTAGGTAATPPMSTPPASTPPAATPPASTPPASTPPASTPPPTTSTPPTGGDGKAVFVAQKCSTCHGVSAAGIAGKARDLSTVGSRHDAAWISAYLRQEQEQNGKKHAKKFTGTDAELQALSSWLASLK